MWLCDRRHREPERMDDPLLDADQHRQALRELARLNRWSLAAWHLFQRLRQLAQELATGLRILDLATGGGDVPLALAEYARRHGYAWEIAGCDVSATAIAYANEQANRRHLPVRFFLCNVLREDWPEDWDVVMCSLFLHHLSEEEALQLLKRMGRSAKRLVLVSDLERSAVNYALVWTATRLLCRSPIVRTDGPISVRAAYSIAEVRRLAKAAWGTGFRLWRRPPARWLLQYRRMGAG
jgi:2-polyprenyl-3-methyl-5-hydroxy-6-metoxy-1,4-benzoquinol methylase